MKLTREVLVYRKKIIRLTRKAVKRFAIGCQCRMGDNCLPDNLLTAPIMRACVIILKSKWESIQQEAWKLLGIATTAWFLLVGYYGALRGEEVTLVDIGVLRKYWVEATGE